MDTQSVVGELDKIAADARQRIEAAPDRGALEELRVELLGKKGVVTGALRGVGSLPADQRAAAGARANALKIEIDQRLDVRRRALEQNRLESLADTEWVDVTFIPEGAASRGHLHPLTQAQREITAIFSRLGYQVALGPEVEDDYHNFQALNIPEGHPARDEWDSFYLAEGGWLLRTHTSPVQIRFMETHQPPIKIIAPGPVYRHEATDAGHESQFHQVEGLLVDEDVRMSDLVGTIEYFSRSMFGADRRIRITGDHFPFTEPSIGAAVSCGICEGAGCSSCKGGWLEIMGAGMVHPQVLRNGGIDPERYSGFAFGMGLDRIAMLKYNIADIRRLRENDLRFLRQF
jgi:phenylalanyl-tRNA synthetase alpha chain